MKGTELIVWASTGALLLSGGTVRCFAEENAVIKGKVIFAGDIADYKRYPINTIKDPNCKKAKKGIGEYGVILNKKTDPVTLRNVLVSIKRGLGDRKYAPPATPVILTQFGCEYVPRRWCTRRRVYGFLERMACS